MTALPISEELPFISEEESAEHETDMTREEAIETCNQIRQKSKETRLLILKMHERKGYLALGYRTFEQFGKMEFHLSRDYLYKLLAAAKIEAELLPPRVYNCIQTGLPLSIPEGHIRELKRLPNAELRRQAYEEAKQVSASKVYASHDSNPSPHNGKLTASLLRSIVSKYLSANRYPSQEETNLPLLGENNVQNADAEEKPLELLAFTQIRYEDGDIVLIEGSEDGKRKAIPVQGKALRRALFE